MPPLPTRGTRWSGCRAAVDLRPARVKDAGYHARHRKICLRPRGDDVGVVSAGYRGKAVRQLDAGGQEHVAVKPDPLDALPAKAGAKLAECLRVAVDHGDGVAVKGQPHGQLGAHPATAYQNVSHGPSLCLRSANARPAARSTCALPRPANERRGTHRRSHHPRPVPCRRGLKRRHVHDRGQDQLSGNAEKYQRLLRGQVKIDSTQICCQRRSVCEATMAARRRSSRSGTKEGLPRTRQRRHDPAKHATSRSVEGRHRRPRAPPKGRTCRSFRSTRWRSWERAAAIPLAPAVGASAALHQVGAQVPAVSAES